MVARLGPRPVLLLPMLLVRALVSSEAVRILLLWSSGDIVPTRSLRLVALEVTLLFAARIVPTSSSIRAAAVLLL